MNSSGSLKHAYMWSLVQHWGARAITFVVFSILARLLSKADFGLVALATIVISFTEIFIDQGFGDAVVQSHRDDESFLSTAFWVNITTGLLLTLAVLVLANRIAELFRAPELALISRVLSVTFFFTALSSVQIALLRRRLDYRALAIRTTIANVLAGIVSCTMAALGAGVWSLVTQQIVFTMVATVVVWRAGGFRPTWTANRADFYELMHFGAKVCGVRTLDLMHTKLIDTLVGVYLGTVVLGVYSVGTKLALILMMLLGSSVSDISLAHFSQLHRSDGEIASAYLRMIKGISLTSVPLFAFLSLEAHPVVNLLFGAKWDQAGAVLSAFCAGGIVQILIYFTNSVLNAVGRPGLQLFLSLAKLGLIAAAFFLFRSQGIGAVSWGTAGVTLLITAPATLVVISRLLGFSLRDLARTLRSSYAAVFLGAVSLVGVRYGLHRLMRETRHIRFQVIELVLTSSVFFLVTAAAAAKMDETAARYVNRFLRRRRGPEALLQTADAGPLSE